MIHCRGKRSGNTAN